MIEFAQGYSGYLVSHEGKSLHFNRFPLDQAAHHLILLI